MLPQRPCCHGNITYVALALSHPDVARARTPADEGGTSISPRARGEEKASAATLILPRDATRRDAARGEGGGRGGGEGGERGSRRKRRVRDPESTLSRFLDLLLLACHPTGHDRDIHTRRWIAANWERERTRPPRHYPRRLAVASRTKAPCAQPRQPPSSSRTRIRMFCTCGVEEEKRRVCAGGGREGNKGEDWRGETRRDGGWAEEGSVRLPRGYNDRDWSYWVRSGLVWMDRDS